MKTIVEQVRDWYAFNLDELTRKGYKSRIRALDVEDEQKRKVEIQIETPTLAASLAFWNKGDVSVLGLRNESNEDIVFDDRTLEKDEDIGALLDRYVTEIESS